MFLFSVRRKVLSVYFSGNALRHISEMVFRFLLYRIKDLIYFMLGDFDVQCVVVDGGLGQKLMYYEFVEGKLECI